MLKEIKFSPKDNPNQSVTISAESKEEAIRDIKHLGVDLSNTNIEEVPPCPYCHDQKDLIETYPKDPYEGDLIYIWEDRLRYESDTQNIARRIRYCPMCGRKLPHYD